MRVSLVAPFTHCVFSIRKTVAPAALFCVAGVLCLVLPPAHGQTLPAPGETAKTVLAPAAKSAAPAAQKAIATESPDKGLNTGIKIHGHWVIEVKNPDGKLVSHAEFENSLQPGGQTALAGLLWGFALGDWAIFVDGASGDTQLPCTSTLGNGSSPCEIVEPGSFFASNCASGLPANLTYAECFPTLVLANDTNHSSSTVGLAGTFVASAAGVITDVQAFLHLCGPSSTPSTCASPNGQVIVAYEFTSRILPAQGSVQCGGTGQPSCTVNVNAGQTVNVSVTYSFQ
jgi:hypothetical protein